ncbi:uncharacterized protein [Coffea arabica]|uniref:Transposase MuDR plant domain-containing protein n=1 Tax=Coffea arabica TaxID=13443 RepID=A0ABM4VQM2_COFAR
MEELDNSSHDGLHSNESSGDEGGSKDVDTKKFRVFNPTTEMDDPKFELGLLFKCKTDFINAAKSHGVKYGRKIRFKKNDSNRCKAICRGKRCMWNIYCSVRSDKVTFQIKSMLLTYTCGRTTYHGLASVTYLANKYLEDIRLNPNFNVGDFMIKVHKDLGVSIIPNVWYKVRAKAKEMIYGDVMSQYSKLWSYCEELQKANPDSNVFMTTTDNNEGDDEFQRFYWNLNGISCAHAIAAICDTGEEPEKFVHDCYSKEAYIRAYKPMISPMNAEQMWKNSDMSPVLSPENIKLLGRPQKVRQREPDELALGKKQNKQ